VGNRIVEGDDYSVLPGPIVRAAQAVRRLLTRSSAGGDRRGVSEVVSRPDGDRILVAAGPHGRGTLDRPGKWVVQATPFPSSGVAPKWYRRDRDSDEALALAAVVVAEVESGRWRPGDGEPDRHGGTDRDSPV
jgi:hypothetical protein